MEGNLVESAHRFSQKLNSVDVSQAPRAKLKLFISFSMSDASIASYIKEANRLGRDNVSLVVNGLKKGTSMKETSSYISTLTKGQNVSVEIDPPSFERFRIKSVPALVVYHDDPMYEAKCAISGQTEELTVLEEWEGTLGDVSIAYSIDKLLDSNESKFKAYLEGLAGKLNNADL
nr:type-F conjugative transfer system pilin assembly protein TrbC [Thiomicrorhabdus aquaedulcis]